MALSPWKCFGQAFCKYAVVHPRCWVRGSTGAYHWPRWCQGYNTQAALTGRGPLARPPASGCPGAPWGWKLKMRPWRAPMLFQQDLLSQGRGWPSPGLQLSLTNTCPHEALFCQGDASELKASGSRPGWGWGVRRRFSTWVTDQFN